MNITTRNANLDDLVTMLQEQHTRKVDIVTPSTKVRSLDGALIVEGAEQQLDEDGVTTVDGTYVPTVVCDEGLASKLDVPVAYLKRLRATGRVDLYDANVNGMLHGTSGRSSYIPQQGGGYVREQHTPPVEPDARSFLVRCFRGDEGGDGIARAFLSDRYARVDNLDVLMSALDGIRESGIDAQVQGGDLTERRMMVRVTAPSVQALAPVLLDGYRSPFTGQQGSDNPTVFAGFKLVNSEVGGGAFSIVPNITIEVCKNGMTMSKDAVTKVHLGGKLEAGVVRYAEDTQRVSLELVRKQTRDAVRHFLSEEYLTQAVARLEQRAEEPVKTHDEVKTLSKGLKFTDEETEGILAYFTQGGQMTRGGVVNAITAYSQTVDDGEQAFELEARATSLLV